MVLFQMTIFLGFYLLFAAGNVKQPLFAGPCSGDTAAIVIVKAPEILVDRLPDEIDESSGLALWDSLVWTLNDSGGEEAIFGLEPQSGRIRKIIRVTNAKNNDWESLAQDDQNWYIGDFGNNWGRRSDLGIWMFAKRDVPDGTDVEVQASRIDFRYKDQQSFVPGLYRTRYDCEAMVVSSGTILLFTKDWLTRKTTLYRMPARPGKVFAEPVDSFNVRGLVTGAAWDPERKLLALSGYENFLPITWLVTGFSGDSFAGTCTVQINWPEKFRPAQTEGVTFYKANELLISSEKTKLEGALYRFELDSVLIKE